MLPTVESSARKLVEKYRLRAAFIAVDRLNASIDRRDFHARDFWAQVVHAIHEFQRAGELSADGYWGSERNAVRQRANRQPRPRPTADFLPRCRTLPEYPP
jgi:hypothetical protein